MYNFNALQLHANIYQTYDFYSSFRKLLGDAKTVCEPFTDGRFYGDE